MRCEARREAADAAVEALRAGVRRVGAALGAPAVCDAFGGDPDAATCTHAALRQARAHRGGMRWMPPHVLCPCR